MRLFYISLLCGAIVNAASTLNFTNESWNGIVTGQPFVLTWKGNTGTVNITLDNGTEAKPNVVNPIATNINSNSYSWTPGSFAVPGKTFFLALTDSAGAKAYGDKFVVAASASTTTSSTSTTSTTKPKPTASSTKSSSATASPTGSQKGKEGNGNHKRNMIIGFVVAFVAFPILVLTLVLCLVWYPKWKKKKAAAAEAGVGDVGGTDGANDARLAEKKGFFGFWGRKGGEKGYTGVAQVHELQADDRPRVQELDGTVRHELQ